MFYYRLKNWVKINRDIQGSCTFGILLDSEFAKKAIFLNTELNQTKRFNKLLSDNLKDSDARITFFDECFLPQIFKVGGNCCCLGVDGNNLVPEKWGKYLEFSGHNIDTRQQAFDLLYMFNEWVETAEALMEE